jgi:hypothetical protein
MSFCALVVLLEISAEPFLVAGGLLCVIVGAAAVAAWLVVARSKRVEAKLARLDRLDDLARDVARIAQGGGDLDLRRLEHVLIDIRDGQKRVEDRLIAVVESAAATKGGSSALALHSGGANALTDRVVTRLLALGYERVQIVTPNTDVVRMVDGDGDIVIEARRDGALCKGRVSVRRGVLTDVQIQAAYSAFP